MKTVIFRAPVLTQSGYGVHSRQIAKWLLSRSDIDVYFQPAMWGNTPWLTNSDLVPELEPIIAKSMTPDQKADVSLQLQLPNEWDHSLANVNVGITAAVETDTCNPRWVISCNSMNAIVVPSNHTKRTLESHGPLGVPIHVVPESYVPACELPAEKLPKLDLDLERDFNILVFGQLNGTNPNLDRKNTLYTLKWLLEEFKDDHDVGIVIKTNAGRNSLLDRKLVTNVLKDVVSNIRGPSGGPPVTLLHGDLRDEEVASLYKHPKIKIMVSLTRGEGFGLPLLEAAASGLPILATDWSGHLDFLNEGKFIKNFYQLQPVPQERIDNNIFMPGARWAWPSESDFKKRIRKFKNSPSIPTEWAADLRTKVLKNYSQERVNKLYDEAIGNFLK